MCFFDKLKEKTKNVFEIPWLFNALSVKLTAQTQYFLGKDNRVFFIRMQRNSTFEVCSNKNAVTDPSLKRKKIDN